LLAKRLLRILILVFVLSMVIQCNFFAGLQMQSNSMIPGLQSGDHVLISPFLFGKQSFFSNKSWMDFSKPSRGDLVVCDPLYITNNGFFYNVFNKSVQIATLGRRSAGIDSQNERIWVNNPVIRRVIALSGDTIQYSQGSFLIRPAGADQFLSEYALNRKTYKLTLPSDLSGVNEGTTVLVPEGMCFVAADNRRSGTDSRQWGAVPYESLRGQVILRYWPFSRFGLLP